ncbi:hypothetical protein I5Q34_16815 [Streptomyces sp. AV19]|uniref:hypothetical protein n=1 Tax=Streptomyces sp. AV19 TaxID=2793068 RepID=UPI0018FEA43C|nr:hypothetical protein [Streptomyces sp. AV19]MBH1935911.1 hypothetical protein [Streptomyces sp. AV19]MDG4534306.1 hypothetical protein [Streptomyces sp. AV19]
MRFWGYLLVGRREGRALPDSPVLRPNRHHLLPTASFGDGWQLWHHPRRPELGDLDALVRALADETGAPALAAYVMESDCAVVSGAGPGGAPWSACLGRRALAGYMADTGLALDELFPDPRAAAAHCSDWAAAAGHTADPAELAAVLAAEAAPSVEDLFEDLLARLGIEGGRRPGPPPPTGEAPAATRCEPP